MKQAFVVWHNSWQRAFCTFAAFILSLGVGVVAAQTTITSTLGSPTAGAGYTTATGSQTGRLNRFAVVSSCASPKASPGTFTTTGARAYDAYTFQNTTGSPQCVAVTLTTTSVALFAVAYNNAGFVAAAAAPAGAQQ